MITPRNTKDQKRKPPKRMLAAGRKIDGVWQVKTFLRASAGDGRQTFWERSGKRSIS